MENREPDTSSQDIFTAEMLADMAEYIRQIKAAGGKGELIIIFVRGHVRFIDRKVGNEYALPQHKAE